MASPVEVMVSELKSCVTHFLVQGLSDVDGNRPVLSQSHCDSLGSQSTIQKYIRPVPTVLSLQNITFAFCESDRRWEMRLLRGKD